MSHQEHVLTLAEVAKLNKITPVIAEPLSLITALFMRKCKEAGIDKKVAAQAFSLYIMSNLARVMAIASGMPPDVIDHSKMEDFAHSASTALAIDVSKYITQCNDDLHSLN
jgi:hypothetical protein